MPKPASHAENIRIIAGKHRSRQIQTPPGVQTRPTASRTRESLFDLLITRYLPQGFHDLVVADFYAGSGALGIEALSRGAQHVDFFEKSGRAIGVLRQNLESVGVTNQATVHQQCLHNASPQFSKPPHVVFCDPPYALDATEMLQRISREVRDHAILCYEHAQSARPVLKSPWRLRTRRTWGAATVSIFEKVPSAS